MRFAVVLSLLFVASHCSAQTYSIFYKFPNAQTGKYPSALLNSNGSFYGTTFFGGPGGAGTVFKLNSQGQETTLYSFPGGNQLSQGYVPESPLVTGSSGSFYSTTSTGGDLNCPITASGKGCGTVFRLSSAGQHTVLYSFTGGTDGAVPSPLVSDSAGNLYGTTYTAGRGSACARTGCGTVFRVTPNGVESTLYTFTGGSDGSTPWGQGPLAIDATGNLYGTTRFGGDLTCPLNNGQGCGAVFKLTPTGHETVLHSFTGNSDGAFVTAPITRDAQGNLYGITDQGGAYGTGTLFKIDAAGNFSVLHDFTDAENGGGYNSGLTADLNGNLYGTTEYGGASRLGSVYEVTSQGVFILLHSFGSYSDGQYPQAPLLRDSAGKLWGTTAYGGTSCPAQGCGVVFEITQ